MSYLEKALKVIDSRSIDQDEVHPQIQSDPEQIAHMTLTEFARSTITLLVYSEVLGEMVYFVPNKQTSEELRKEGVAVYTAKELLALARNGFSVDILKALHHIKVLFPGSEVVQ